MFKLGAFAATAKFQCPFFIFMFSLLYVKLSSIVSFHSSVSLSQACQLNHFRCFCHTKMLFCFVVKLITCNLLQPFQIFHQYIMCIPFASAKKCVKKQRNNVKVNLKNQAASETEMTETRKLQRKHQKMSRKENVKETSPT